MKTNIFLSVLTLAAVLNSAVTYADETGKGDSTDDQVVETTSGKKLVDSVTGAMKKTVKTVKDQTKLGESTAPTGDNADGDDAVEMKPKAEAVKMEQKAVATKTAEDDSKDAEASRVVSDTSITIFSQNPYIQSIMESTTHIKSARLKELMARGDKMTMLDIRPRSEFAKTPGIKGVTLNIPRNFLEVEAYEKLPNKDASIIIISTKGIRGGLAANTLQNMGYTNVRNLMDGLQGWNKDK